ncbi:WD repeat-containing protein 6, partial [Coemansia sp. RSA 2607]
DLELDECVPSRCAILTSARDGVMHEFLLSVRRSSASMEVGSEEHVRVAPMANSAVKSADSAYLACIERKTSERLTSGSICRLLRMQNRLYAVTYCRNRIVIIDVLSAVELFSFSFAETDRRWRIQYSGGRMMFVSFMNKLEVLQRHVSLYDETAYYRLADGISSLDIRGADCICVADTAFGGMLVAIGGEDSVLRVLAYDEKRSESKLRPVVQAKRHTSMIRCIRFVPQFNTRSHTQDSRFRYLLTAGASCELRCWRMDIDDEITVLEWAVAPVFASDTESRIMDLAIVDQFTVLQTGHEVVLLAT